jgi:hypothetical protein
VNLLEIEVRSDLSVKTTGSVSGAGRCFDPLVAAMISILRVTREALRASGTSPEDEEKIVSSLIQWASERSKRGRPEEGSYMRVITKDVETDD